MKLSHTAIDVEKKENCLPYDSIKLPTATNALMLSLKISGSKKLKLKENCVMLLKSLILKMQERSPLNYLIVRVSHVLFQNTL